MKYLPTIDLWANNGLNQDKIRNGELRLQIGQWVQCGPGPKSRFVCLRDGGSIWVVHRNGNEKQTTGKHFSRCAELWTGKRTIRKYKKGEFASYI
jgi:hypothetical protein